MNGFLNNQNKILEYHTSNIPGITLLQKKFTDLINQYCISSSDKIPPYCHGERSLLSILSAAAWPAGYIALAEYSEFKQRASRTRSQYSGNIDLVLEKNKIICSIESKFQWLGLRSLNRQDAIIAYLNAAVMDAKKIRSKEYKYKVGLNFVCPFLKSESQEKLTSSINYYHNYFGS